MFRRCLTILCAAISFVYQTAAEKNTDPIAMQKMVKPGAPKLLIISSAPYGGHASVVKALSSLLQNTHEIHVIKSEDLRRFNQDDFGLSYYHSMSSNPALTYWLRMMDEGWQAICPKIPMPIINLAYKLDEFSELLRKNDYRMVVFTSPAHIQQINAITKNHNILSMTIATDYGEPEPGNSTIWLMPECDIHMCARNSYFADRNPKKIPITEMVGMPIRPEFTYIRRTSKQEAKRNIGVDPSRPCVLIMTGAAAMKSIVDVANQVKNDTTKTYIFMCGTTKSVYDEIKNMNVPHFIVLQYVDKPMMYMRAADVMINKPGAISVTEAVQCETICIFKAENIVPGMRFLQNEEPTARYIEDQNMGCVINDFSELIPTINRMLETKHDFPLNNALNQCVYMIRQHTAQLSAK